MIYLMKMMKMVYIKLSVNDVTL